MGCMHKAVEKVSPHADFVLVDGNRLPWGHAEGKRANGTMRPADPSMPAGPCVPLAACHAFILSFFRLSLSCCLPSVRVPPVAKRLHPLGRGSGPVELLDPRRRTRLFCTRARPTSLPRCEPRGTPGARPCLTDTAACASNARGK